jgi:hypothetical protein
MAKSHLAPLKAVTIPRLELSAATVSTRLDKIIKKELEFELEDSWFWTDSTLVLRYLENEDKRFKTFVANRVSIIQDASRTSQWHYVSSKCNPADDASRGLDVDSFLSCRRWHEGPRFLRSATESWPKNPVEMVKGDADLEMRKEAVICSTKVDSSHGQPLQAFIERYSSWYKLQKATAWLLRFIKFLKEKAKPAPFTRSRSQNKERLTVDELRRSAVKIISYVQVQCYPEERKKLMKMSSNLDMTTCGKEGIKHTKVGRMNAGRRAIGGNSTLRKLNPIMVEDVMRVGGRLERANISFHAKHPIILPPKHHLTNLIIRHYHAQDGHAGVNHVLASIRQKFWIVKGQSEVRRVLSKCMECKKRNGPLGAQIMAPLPEARVTPSEYPFAKVGIDYFGPLTVKQKRSHVKRYGCIFTCMAVRAVHIEIAHSLETESFLGALSRFTSRRGVPKEIFSDNGTNFKGAETVLREEFSKLSSETAQDKIVDHLRQQSITWHFNAPLASHTGGVWERLIRSVRKILRAILGEQIVNDETLLTVIAETERILNDRPITRLSDDPNDLRPLSPNDILLLRANSCSPIGKFSDADNYRKCWRQAQCLANTFWKRWIREYLAVLQERQKWTRRFQNLKVGDLVLVADINVPRGKWPMGRVVEVFPDLDDNVRQVSVRTSTSTLKRDVRKLCLLEAENSTN